MGNALDDPEPFAPRQARAALEYAKPRANPRGRLLQQSGLSPQRRDRRQRLSRRRDPWGFATPDALHRVQSPRRRRQPVMAASWLTGPGDRGLARADSI